MEILSCDFSEKQWKMIRNAFDRGELIVYPTDTLYALGVNPFDKKAMKRLFDAKGRPLDMPISVAASNIEMIEQIAVVNELAHKIFKAFLPGPLTLLLKKKGNKSIPFALNKGLVGIRVPNHPVALKLINTVGLITATSANKHGGKNPIVVEDAVRELGEQVAYYINCGLCEFAKPSTIIDISENKLKLVREGAIAWHQLRGFMHG